MAASLASTKHFVFLFLTSLAIAKLALAGDPDILSDFLLPPGSTIVGGNYFAYTGMRFVTTAPPPTNFTETKVSKVEFLALEGQSVSSAVLRFPPGEVNPPHTHPRAAELLFLVQGSLQVGFVDTANKLYTQRLQGGDLFVFPKGLVHFQYNPDSQKMAVVISAFGSANPGFVPLPPTLFITGIDENVLAESFKTTVATIQALKTGLTPRA